MDTPILIPNLEKGGTYSESSEVDVKAWLAKEGDNVSKGQPLVSLDFEKAEVELVSPASGVLTKVFYAAGKTVFRKDRQFPALGMITSEGGAGPAESGGANQAVVAPETSNVSLQDIRRAAQSPDDDGIITPVARNLMEAHGITVVEIRERFSGKITKKEVEIWLLENSKPTGPEDRVLAVPAARQFARDSGIDIAAVSGSGPGGLVLLADVESAREAALGADLDDEDLDYESDTDDAVEVVAISRRRRTIASVMESAVGIPIAGPSTQKSFHGLVWLKKVYAERFAREHSFRLRIWVPLMVALVRTLAKDEFSILNSRWNKATEQVERYRHVNMGISFDDGGGLRIFVVRRAEQYALAPVALAKVIDDLFLRIETKTTTLADEGQATFIFNNIGALGHEMGYSIFPPTMAGLLNFGVIEPKTNLAWLQFFFDHRITDGHLAGDFLQAVYDEMEAKVIPNFISSLH